jgi:isocitrate dehydrogenase (NAD+)
MDRKVTLLPGDGIGPEIAQAVCKVFDAAGAGIEWERISGTTTIGSRTVEFPLADAVASVRRNRVALKGPMATGVVEGPPSINVALRKSLGLYANLRPVKNIEGVNSRWSGVDLVIVRENTEDLYAGLEHTVVPGVVESLKIITEAASTHIAHFAFEYARKHNRKCVHTIHKANIMKLSDGLFLTSARHVAESYPEIEYKEMIVDNACMQLVMNPQQFDILLMPNLYGDLISDLAAGLVGGLGLVPSGNMGDDAGLFEAVHGTAPDIAGKGFANPTALLLSGVMMLDYLGDPATARCIETAVHSVYRDRKCVTRDLGGTASTTDFTNAVIAAIGKPVAR